MVARNSWQGAVIYNTLQAEPLAVVASNSRMLARVLVTADVLRRYRPGQQVKVDIHGSVRPAKVYSLGVEAVRVEYSGAVYELDAVFDVRPGEVLRPSEAVQLILP